MSSGHGGEITLDAATAAYGDVFSPNGARLTLVVEVGNDDAVDVTLQGSIDGTNNWRDTATVATALNNTGGHVGPAGGDGTIFAAWPYYRLKVSAGSSSSNVVTWRVKAFD